MGKKAFTLIELLVVIAIIAILMSILMPALRAAKVQAQALHCQANLKTLCLAWLMYKDENDDKMVGGNVGSVSYDWVRNVAGTATVEEKKQAIRDGALFRYAGKKVEVYHCPADQRLKDPVQTAYRTFSIAGGANGEEYGGGVNSNYERATKYSEIKNPSLKYVFLEDIDNRKDLVGSWVIRFAGPPEWVDPLAMWHNRRSAFSYADGHTEMHKWHAKYFIDWCRAFMVDPTGPGAHFHHSPEPDIYEEDYQFAIKGFPCKSHK